MRALIERFLLAFNTADKAAMRAALSSTFRGYAIGPPERHVVAGRDDTIEYFAERAARGESLTLDRLVLVPYLNPEVGFQLVVHRELPDGRVTYEGKGAVYYGSFEDARGIIVLSCGIGTR